MSNEPMNFEPLNVEPLSFEPLTGVLGAVVRGVDVSTSLSDETIAALRQGLLEHHVLFFRDQTITPEQQMAFGRRFGELDEHPFVHGRPDHPEILEIITEANDRVNFGGGWHSDVTFLEEPDLGSILYAVDVPAAGGDTLFANQQAAYEGLSSTMKRLVDGLVAIHSAAPQYGPGGYSTMSQSVETKSPELATARVEHPIVRTHPESGRKGLYVNPAFTVGIKGMRPDEEAALLQFLFKHGSKEVYTCRFRWEVGSLAMWDNRSVMHYALHDYAGKRRHMRRITVKGDRPF
jgi:taurine dioxygenase